MSTREGKQLKCPECGHRWKIPADEWADACPKCGYDDNDYDEKERK